MTNPGIYHLFVYGSLRSGFKSPAYEYISRFFNLVADARVHGKLYDLGPYCAAVPRNEDDNFIVGELYQIRDVSEFPWAIAQLDDYEGINGEPEEQSMYRRDIVDVLVGDQTIKAWIYWYSGDVSGRPQIDSGDVIEYMNSKN
jgi:gamma-glutamylcyclotransferase (GGCT)/AIG2-like uncharacterized protein YtfP